MYKKIISVMSVALVIFLCSFPAFAVTGGGKTIISSSYSYNNGDVTLYTRVNGHDATESYTGGDRIYSYQHAFTVTLANNTNEFQVADTNSFTVDLYTGYTDTFSATTTNTPSGSQMYRPSWGSEVTSYSDNMSAPRILMYSSGNYAGHVLISFEDTNLLVLNPNETREYNFTINFNMSYDGINQYPINGNAQYSYFTYTGSVSMYSRPTGFNGNTINDFITNNSIPDTVVAYLMSLYENGNITNEELSNILSSVSYTGNYAPYTSGSTASNANSYTDNGVSILSYGIRSSRSIIDNAIYYNAVTDDYNSSYSYKYNYNYFIRFINNNTYPVKFSGTVNLTIPSNLIILNYISDAQIIRVNENTINIINLEIPANTFYSFYISGECSFVDSNLSNNPGITSALIINGHFMKYDPNSTINGTEQQVHQQEMDYYSQSNTAIGNSGINDYQFSSEQSGGISGVSNDFIKVWNACGSLSSLWIFSLTLSLALYIIHHVPRQRSS